jgi:hypothetical protein
MAIDLKSLSKPRGDKPIICTIFSEGGMGKTTLAAMFPSPVFIRTEDGSVSLVGNDDVQLFPEAQSTADVMDAITALSSGGHDRKTLVIDSVTQFEKLAVREILDTESNPKAKSMAAAHGGFGKAFGILDAKHQELREACGYLVRECGMNVVFLIHATVEELELPDIDKYSRYTVALHKNKQHDCSHHYTNNVDLVAFIRLKTNVRSTENGKKRALSDGEREIICYPVASNVSKNRFNITEPLPFTFEGGNPFIKYAAQ